MTVELRGRGGGKAKGPSLRRQYENASDLAKLKIWRRRSGSNTFRLPANLPQATNLEKTPQPPSPPGRKSG